MKSILIINALIWAAVIFIASWFFRDSENYNYLLGALVVGFTLQNGLTYQFLKRQQTNHQA